MNDWDNDSVVGGDNVAITKMTWSASNTRSAKVIATRFISLCLESPQ
jgi:hypothetical protein